MPGMTAVSTGSDLVRTAHGLCTGDKALPTCQAVSELSYLCYLSKMGWQAAHPVRSTYSQLTARPSSWVKYLQMRQTPAECSSN